MRLVSYMSGAVSREIQFEECMPPNGIPWGSLTIELRSRYKFAISGRSEKAAQLGVVAPAFQSGEFVNKGQIIPVIGCEITGMELTGVCNTTMNASQFLDDVMNLLESKFSFKQINVKNETYTSQIVMEPSFEFLSTLGRWEQVYDVLKNKASEYRLRNEIVPFGIKFVSSDRGILVDDPTAGFTFERRVTSKTSDNWYFSAAPFKSDDHLRLLERMDEIFVAGR